MPEPPSSQFDLMAQLREMRSVLDHVGAYVFTKDPQGRYTYANRMVCELFQRPLEAVVGCTDEDFFDLSVSNDLRINDRRVLDHGERIEREETNIIADSGETRVYWTVKLPLRDAGGIITGMCGISTDITERRRLEHTVREQKQLLDLVLHNIDAYVYMKDAERRYRYANPKVAELYGLSQADINGRRDEEILSATDAEGFAIADREVLAHGKKVCTEEIFVKPDGEVRHYWSIKMPLLVDGEVEGLVGVSTDITEVVRLKDEFLRLSRTDALTGIANRRHLLELAEHELLRSHRAGTRVAVLFFDIDHFKSINNLHGHAVGDHVLQRVAEVCAKRVREADLFGRFGGDEFVIMMSDVEPAQARTLANHLREALADESVELPDGSPLRFSCSFGMAASHEESSIDALIASADAALYRAKALGRNQVWLADEAT
jgi:diguanylate cyclase (GGDEF)-like protein/PAS domain S-box-containing protein